MSQAPVPTKDQIHVRSHGPTERGRANACWQACPSTERRLRLHGISTAVLEGGDGPPIVLLHGPGGYAAHWLHVIPGLTTTHRVIAPDLPGHGASEIGDGPLDADRVLAWLGELIERTCASPPGSSGNCSAARSPPASPPSVPTGSTGSCCRHVRPAPVRSRRPSSARRLTDFMAQPTEHTHDQLWQHCAFDLDALRRAHGLALGAVEAYNLDRARTPSVQAALHALMQQFGLPAIAPADLARIAVPATLIWGRHDRARRSRSPRPRARAMAGRCT